MDDNDDYDFLDDLDDYEYYNKEGIYEDRDKGSSGNSKLPTGFVVGFWLVVGIIALIVTTAIPGQTAAIFYVAGALVMFYIKMLR